MNNLTIINKNGQLFTNSKEVAGMIDIRHDNLLAKIASYSEVLTTSNLRALDFFIQDSYEDEKGEPRKCYLLTKKGCDMVANKMIGKKGILFTATYVTKFDEMEKSLKAPYQNLSKELQSIFVLDQKQQKIENRMDKLEDNMPLFNVECKELQALVRKTGIKALGGYRTPAYNDNSLRGKVYSDIQYQLKREFGIERYEAIKRVQLKTASQIVEGYKLPIVLESEIQLANDQISIDKEIN